MLPQLYITILYIEGYINGHSYGFALNLMEVCNWKCLFIQMRRKGMHVGYWWESQEERDH
jgi:hypothetical protein